MADDFFFGKGDAMGLGQVRIEKRGFRSFNGLKFFFFLGASTRKKINGL